MADDILKNIWNELSSKGKTDSDFGAWKTNVEGSEDIQKNVYGYLKDNGYTESEFSAWQGNVLPAKTNDSASADPAVESQSSTGFKSEDGSSEPRDASDFANTQEENVWLEDYFGKTGLTDFVGDLYRAGSSGWTAGASVDESFDLFKKGKDMTDAELNDFLAKTRDIENSGRTDEMIALTEKQNQLKKEGYNGVSAFFLGWWDNPSAMLQYSVQSLVQMGSALVDSEEVIGTAAAASGAGALTGAAIGSTGFSAGPLGVFTTAGGALTGTTAGFFGGLSGAMEVGMTTAQLMQEQAEKEGYAWGSMSDKERFDYVRKLTSDTEKFGELKSNAVARGIAIGSIDALTAGLTGGAGAAARKSVAAGARSAFAGAAKTATVAAVETTGGMLSEVAGQAAAGQEFNLEEILIEGFADKTFTGASIIQSAVQGSPKYSINGQKMNGKEFSDALKLMDDEAYVAADIKVENSPAVDKLIGDRRQNIAADQNVDSRINNIEDRTKAINLVKEQKKLGSNAEGNKIKLTQIKAELDAISKKYENSEVDATIEERKQAVANAVDTVFEAEFNKNYKALKEAETDTGIEPVVFEDDNLFAETAAKDLGVTKEYILQEAPDGVFVGGGKVYINKNRAKASIDIATGNNGAISVTSHEVLHPIFNALIGGAKSQGQFVKQFKKQMTSKQKAYVNKRLKAYKDNPGAEAIELMNLFSDGIISGDINYDQTTFEKLGNSITNLFRSAIGLKTNEISFEDGRGVFNFLKEYNTSVKAGKVSDKAIAAIKTAESKEGATKVADAKMLSDTQFSKTVAEAELALQEAEDADPNDPNYLDNLEAAEDALDAAEKAAAAPKKEVVAEVKKEVKPKPKVVRPEKPTRTTDLGPRDPLSKKIMDTYKEDMEGIERTEYKGSKPLPVSLERKLVPMFEGYINTIVQQKFKQFATEALEFQDALSILRAEVSSAIRTYNPAKNKDLAGYVKKIVQTRQSLMFKDANTAFSTDINDAKGVVATEDTQSIDRSGTVERGQATFDELDIVDDALIKDIAKDLEKEIRVRTQKGTLSETVSIKKGRETYLVSWLENYVNKQLFKKLSKKLGAIGEKNGETVIPGAYIDFLNDPKTFDIITKALPIKSIKKSYGKLFPTEKVGREVTAEGNPIFKISKIEKRDFLTYFVKGKKSTILERQKQLFREILEPLAKQVVADYATTENLSELKSIQELAPDASLDAQANIIIEAQLNDLESKLDRYKGEDTGFDIIQFSKTVTSDQKNEIKAALNPLLDSFSNLSFKYKVVEDILGRIDEVKNFKDLAEVVWTSGQSLLSKPSVRRYRAQVLKLLANKLNYTDTVKFLISAINENQKVYEYQQKVIGFEYSTANFKSSLSNAKTKEAKAYQAELFLKYVSRSIRTLKLDGLTKNSILYKKLLTPILGDPTKYGFSLVEDKEKNRSYIFKDGVKLEGLADVTKIKANFKESVNTINKEAEDVRNWLLGEAAKAKINNNVDSFIGFISLLSADQRGAIRKMSSAGFEIEGLTVKDSVLEHETEAADIAKAWKEFAQGDLTRKDLIKFLEESKVNLVDKKLDDILREVRKNSNGKIKGKARYLTNEVKNYLKGKKIIQYSKSTPIDTSKIAFSKTVNEANNMANRVDAPVKGISVWDFDDTLATTKSNVLYTLPGQTQVFHGGSIKSPKDIRGFVYFSEDKNQADAYSEGNQGETRSFAIDESAIGTEDQVRDVIEELGIQPKDTDWRADESSLYELIDDRFEQAFSKKDMARLADALGKRKLKAARFEDTNISTGKNQGRYTENIVVFDKKAISELNKINATEFALKADQLAAQGANFDFSEFSKVMNGAKGPMFDKAVARNNKFGNDNVYILTARPADSKYAIQEFLEGIGLDIQLDNIVGLGDGTAIAKAKWVVGKVAEGYNDFYFADDAYKNVKAVQEVLEQADVKSKVHQAKIQFSKTLNKEFNNIIEDTTGIDAKRIISDAKGKVLGKKKGRFKFFIAPSADDFAGLMYNLTGKGAKGDAHQAWFKEALFDPFARGIREFESYKQNATAIVNQLKKSIKNIPAGLSKENSTGFTNEVAVRVYLWVKNGYDIPGLTAIDQKELVQIVEDNPQLKAFAEQMNDVLGAYPEPQNDWLAGTITTDAINMVNTVKRAEFLKEWQDNADVIFSKENINKMRAAFGDNYVEALKDMLYRMKTGRNRPSGANRLTNKFMNWVNDAVGTIMFFNTRSALLQTLSIVNFINWHDNNPIQAAKAFGNQKQFWSDFSMLFNSDFLKQRRSGLKNDVNADDIASAAETATNKTKAVFASLLKAGFLPTQIADSFAIAMGGASFIRNRINVYISEGMTEADAKEKAFLDFQEIAEETQQSSRPDRISQQQASPLGRIVLAFANTPMQYMRLSKKAFLDLKNGRGDAKTNITKIIYYTAVQNAIFSSLQAALFAVAFDDDEDAAENKNIRVANSMLDSILRGLGVYGAIASTLKNIGAEIYSQDQKDRPDYTVAAQRALSLSPPIDSKMRKIMSAARAFSYKTTREKMKGFSLDNPAFYAGGQVVSAAFNLPLDRVIKKADNIRVALDNETKMWQSIALMLGYSQWDLGLIESGKTGKSKNKGWHNVKRGSWKDEKGSWKSKKRGSWNKK